jgi:hypothetical protein
MNIKNNSSISRVVLSNNSLVHNVLPKYNLNKVIRKLISNHLNNNQIFNLKIPNINNNIVNSKIMVVPSMVKKKRKSKIKKKKKNYNILII